MRMKPGDLVKHKVGRGWDPRSNRIAVLVSCSQWGDWWKVLERDAIAFWFTEDITLI